MRPLLRASRTATATTFHPVARIATTSRYKAASATAAAPSPAKSTTSSSYARKTPSPAAKASKPSSSTVAAAAATPATTTFPTAPAYVPPPSSQTQTSDQTQQQQPQQQQQQQQQPIDWSTSYHGLGTARFPKEVVDILLQPVNPSDVEVKPDGIIYLPEIKYRRILNQAFGPGGWGLVPKGDVVVGEKVVTREYALIAEGRYGFFLVFFFLSLDSTLQSPLLVQPAPNIHTSKPPTQSANTTIHTASSPKPKAKTATSPSKTSPPPSKAANQTP